MGGPSEGNPWLLFRYPFHWLDRELNGAHEPLWAEVAVNLGFGQTIVDQVAPEPLGFWWIDGRSSCLRPYQPNAVAAISLDYFPGKGHPPRRSAECSVFGGVGREFI